MRPRTIGGVNCLSIYFVLSRNTTVRFIRNVLSATNKIILECCKGGVLRERHGSQAIAGTSGGPAEIAEHVHPEDHFALTLRKILCLGQ